MHTHLTFMAGILLATTAGAWGQESLPTAPPALPAEALDPEMDVLTRGPVHEAFAEQISPDPGEGLITTVAPPEPINEVPPEMRPEGEDVYWFAGYWFFDDERNEHVWVSGVWRRVPPGRRWVPGHWQDVEGGYQWVAGFWNSDSVEEVEYVDAPPESLETGPSSPPPSTSHFWMPGNWLWNVGQYQWRPGNWCLHRDGWVWVASHYSWTPRGCVYVPGYWDYPLTLRGHLFAPVYFRSPIYRRAGYAYRPVCWIGYESLLLHLFVRPHCNHLYFGDYYAPLYRQRHYEPCYAYHSRYRGYSSLYVYYQHHYRRHGIDYCGRVRGWHNVYTRHADYRPAHTYRSQLRHRSPGNHRHHDLLARPFDSTAGAQIAGRRLVSLSSEQRSLQQRHSNQLRDLGHRRSRFEIASKRGSGERSPGEIGAGKRGSGELGPGKRGSEGNRVTNASVASLLSSHGRLALPQQVGTTSTSTNKRGGKRGVPSDILRANRDQRSADPLVSGSDPDARAATERHNSSRKTAQLRAEPRTGGNLSDLTSRGRAQRDRSQAPAARGTSEQRAQFRSRNPRVTSPTATSPTVTRPAVTGPGVTGPGVRNRAVVPQASDAPRRTISKLRSPVPGSSATKRSPPTSTNPTPGSIRSQPRSSNLRPSDSGTPFSSDRRRISRPSANSPTAAERAASSGFRRPTFKQPTTQLRSQSTMTTTPRNNPSATSSRRGAPSIGTRSQTTVGTPSASAAASAARRSAAVSQARSSSAASAARRSASASQARSSAALLRGQMRGRSSTATQPTLGGSPSATTGRSAASRVNSGRSFGLPRSRGSSVGKSGSPSISAPRASSASRSMSRRMGSGSSSGASRAGTSSSTGRMRSGSSSSSSGSIGRRGGK